MPRKDKTTKVVLNLLLSIFIFTASFQAGPVFALTEKNNISELPAFANFALQAQGGGTNELRSVYVPAAFALSVVQQPLDDPYYVSTNNGEVTQFSTASLFGSVGLLAHNTLSGRLFSKLEVGMEVRLIFGDGQVENFIVTEVLQYQALTPESSQSDFRSLDGRETLSAVELFDRVYSGEYHVTFQTCILQDGEPSWGRLFVIAEPVKP